MKSQNSGWFGRGLAHGRFGGGNLWQHLGLAKPPPPPIQSLQIFHWGLKGVDSWENPSRGNK